MLSGIGMLKYLHANSNNIGDIIPVDIVSDEVIVTGALCANTNDLNVFNCGSSSKNPMLWGLSKKQTMLYWTMNPPEKRLSKPNIRLIKNDKHLRFLQLIRRIPALAYLGISNIVNQ